MITPRKNGSLETEKKMTKVLFLLTPEKKPNDQINTLFCLMMQL